MYVAGLDTKQDVWVCGWFKAMVGQRQAGQNAGSHGSWQWQAGRPAAANCHAGPIVNLKSTEESILLKKALGYEDSGRGGGWKPKVLNECTCQV